MEKKANLPLLDVEAENGDLGYEFLTGENDKAWVLEGVERGMPEKAA